MHRTAPAISATNIPPKITLLSTAPVLNVASKSFPEEEELPEVFFVPELFPALLPESPDEPLPELLLLFEPDEVPPDEELPFPLLF